MLSIIKNFFINLGNTFKKPRTIVYPKERIIIPEESRGALHLKLDLDSLDVVCNGCGHCQEICPQDCIEVRKKVEAGGKEVLGEFSLDLGKCTFCGNCVEYCEFEAINMSYRHQLAEFKLKKLKIKKSDLIKQAGTIRDFWNK